MEDFQQGSFSKVDLLIITALAEELSILQQVFHISQEFKSTKASQIYHIGKHQLQNGEGAYQIAITCLHSMGNTDAGVLTTSAIDELNPDYVFMFGIAGGFKDRVNIGDVVVSTEIFYFEKEKITPKKNNQRPAAIQTDAVLQKYLANYAMKTPRPYKVSSGPMAVGEKVIANTKYTNKLKEYHSKLLGIEMESYGVALAAHNASHRPRFIAVRGICDLADEKKNDDFRQKALNNAANFLCDFLINNQLPSCCQSCSGKVAENKTILAIHHLSLDQFSIPLDNIEKEYSVKVLTIDQTEFYNNGILTDPFEAYKHQQEFEKELIKYIAASPHAKLAYFAIAHIPFVFHLGYELNLQEVQVFSSNRQTRRWDALQSSSEKWPSLIVESSIHENNICFKEVAITMSISYPVLFSQVDDLVDISSIPRIQIGLENPEPDIVVYEQQLENYAKVFQHTLVNVRKTFPQVEMVHLFFSGPPTLAFRCGQQISKTIDPNVLVYNFSNKDTPNYGWALNIQKDAIINFREIYRRHK